MARTKAEPDLKPCPFCGSTFMWTLNYAEWDSEQGIVHPFKIACCVIQNPGFATRHEAVLAWNKRAEKVASSAAKILKSKTASRSAKAAAASALTQRKR